MKKMLQILVVAVFVLAGYIFADTQGTTATVLNESFDGSFPPSGWTLFSEGVAVEGWQQSSAKSRTGINSAVGQPQFLYGQKIWLVTPEIDLTSAPSAKLYFYEDQENWSDGGGTNTVAVSTTDPNNASSFTAMLEMTPANHAISGFSGALMEVDLSAYIGESTVYVGFAYDEPGSPTYSWYLDDIKVVVPSEHDVMAFSIDMNDHYSPNAVITPAATVQNEGLNAETFDVEFGYYDWDNNPVVLNTKTVTGLASDLKSTVIFDDYTIGRVGYNFFIKTILADDMDSTNDEVGKFINSYQDQKSVVLAEKFTDVNCTYCPGAARALDSLHHDYPDNIAIIAYHGGFSDTDPYDNQHAEDRRGYYSIGGYPTTFFGGDQSVAGGAAHDADWVEYPYLPYQAAFLAEQNEYTPFTMNIEWTENGNIIEALATATYQGETLVKNNYLRWALVESHIAYNWMTSMDSLHFVELDMYDDATGTKIWNGTSSPVIGSNFEDQISFTVPGGVLQENCELIAFIQDDDSKEVLVTAKVNLGGEPSAIGDDHSHLTPGSFALNQNYPNPFNPMTAISYQLSENGRVQLIVYNSLGQNVRTLVNQVQKPGVHSAQFDAGNLASGIYYYKLNQGHQSIMRKMIIMK